MQNYLEFRAVGNIVLGVLDTGMVEQGYANEITAMICSCASVPGWIAEDVAQEMADMLNAQLAHGIRFSLPNEKG